MPASNSQAAYSAQDVLIRISPAGLGPIEIKAKSLNTFAAIARNDPAQFRVTGHFGHIVVTRASDRAVKFTVTPVSTAPESALLRALQNANDASADAGTGPIACSIVISDPNGKRVLWTMAVGFLTDYPDEEWTTEDGELAYGFTGAAAMAPV